MFSRANKLFISPRLKDRDQSRLAHLLGIFLLAGLAFTLLATIINVLFSDNPGSRYTLHLGLFAIFFIPLVLLYLGHLRLATRLLIYPLWLVITLLIIASGGTSSLNIAGLILLIFIAGTLAGKKDGLIIAALNVITILVILTMTVVGQFPAPIITYSPVVASAVIIIYLVVAALLLYLALNNLAQALRRIREHEQENRIITEEALAGVYIIQEGQLVYTNPALQQITGYEVNELLGKPLIDLIHPDDHE